MSEGVRTLISFGAQRLTEAGVPSPMHDARALLMHAIGIRPFDRPLELLDGVEPGAAEAYRELIARRARREPLQHIIGEVTFRTVDLRVRPGVFIPRPETEIVAGVALDAANAIALPEGAMHGRVPIVVDLCCGTGAIACAMVEEVLGGPMIYAVDVSDEAVELATWNLQNVSDGEIQGRVLQGSVADPDLLSDLRGTVDVVVSNPPYIPAGAVPRDPEVTQWDPPAALYGGGPDGEDIPRAVAYRAADLLRDGGVFVMEHGDLQGESMRDLVSSTGAFEQIETGRDLTGRDRYVRAVRRVRAESGRLSS